MQHALKASLFGTIALLVTTGSADAQPATRATDVNGLRALEAECNRVYEHERALAVQWALDNDVPLREEFSDGRISEIVSVSGGCPTVLTTDNAVAADSISADRVYAGGGAGLSLSGAGVQLHEWDGGRVRTTHVELIGAAVWADDTTPGLSDHSTHVAGTMIGMGAVASARGMSYGATLDSYDWTDDDAEMAAAAAAGARVSNHSYSFITGWYHNGANWYWYGNPALSQTEDDSFGFYDASSQAWDQIAYNAPYYLICKSAGNDRNDTWSGGHYVWSGGWVWSTTLRGADGGALGYDSIAQKGCAKNILTIGAVNDVPGGYTNPGSVSITSFSGWGPTDDGRIKPDIVANGAGLYSSVTASDASYASMSGTSMSGPSAAGALGLLVQHYRATHGGADMRAATLKGLALHTADECGAADGPDYSYGWGLLNVETAATQITVDIIDDDVIQELSLSQGQTIQQAWHADGNTSIKATICWTDPAGTPVGASLDPPNIMLVNDLDLRIIGPGSTVNEPWILNPASPASAATRGDNIRDNVESVVIDTPAAGAYTLEITHKGTLVGGPQDVALILSRVDSGPLCPGGEIPDCNGNCAPAAWLGDANCDTGGRMYGGNAIDFSCQSFGYDAGDCPLPDAPYILWRNAATGLHALWFMDGETLQPETGVLQAMPSAGWTIVGSGDFDGDGKSDLLWRDLASGQNRIWFMTGTSLTPDEQVMTPAGVAWTVAATDDFDADGKCDIFWRNNTTGQNALWFMDGVTLRPETALLPTVGGLSWQVVGSGDFDGDGMRDAWWRNAANGQNAIWFLDGTNMTVDTQLPASVSVAWRVFSTRDIDGDGKADVLWRNIYSGQNAVWFMDGTTIRPETGLLPSASVGWQIVAVADFDSDTDPDVLWRNTANGQNYMWFLQGTSLVPSGAFTSAAGTIWTVIGADE